MRPGRKTRKPMRTNVLGMGNVLMGDDGFGPYVVRILQSRYEVPGEVSILDVGTPGFDLVPYLRGTAAVILVDTVRATSPPGTLKRYDRETLLRYAPALRAGPHDPTVKEALLTLEWAGEGPREVVLVGVVPERLGSGSGLSPCVRSAVEPAVQAVLQELIRLGVTVSPKEPPDDPDLWWERA